jgi:hypothetical protein
MSCGIACHAGGTLSPSSCPTSVYGHRPPHSTVADCGCCLCHSAYMSQPSRAVGAMPRSRTRERARIRGGGGGGSGASRRPVTSTELYKFRKWFDGNSAFASRTACQCCEIARNAAIWHATCHVTRSPEVKMHAPHATVYVRCHAPRHPLLPCLGAAQPQPHPLGRHTARSGTTRCDSLRAGAAWRARSCRAGYHAGWDRAPA